MSKLIERVKQGERQATREFYEKYAPEVRAYLVVKLPKREDVEEVLQDTFMAAFDSLALFREDASVKTWILSIAKHEVADFYRKRYARELVEKTGELFEGVAVEMRTPEFMYKKKRVKRRIEAALSSLSESYRRVLHLKYEVGLSVKEIAEKLDKSFKATESMLYRARMAFIEAYEKNGA